MLWYQQPVTYDYCIIGGGIVGLATAMQLLESRPDASLVLLEKETELGVHQTGHNSGVIHAGIYYAPGSLKAELCRRGAQATKDFAAQHGIPVNTTGKLLVATNAIETARMDALFERAAHNKLEVERIDAAELRRRDPHVRGVGALYVSSTAITDYGAIARTMGTVIRERGATVELGIEVTGIEETSDLVTVTAGERRISARRLVVCAGLQADRLARMAGARTDFQIIPFRGEYYRLPPTRNDVVSHLIYPIPDPNLPFLGVHLTRTIDGAVTVGPNAVLGFAREGYRKWSFRCPRRSRIPALSRNVAGGPPQHPYRGTRTAQLDVQAQLPARMPQVLPGADRRRSAARARRHSGPGSAARRHARP